MASQDKPDSVTGGCLCEAVRYTITFPPDHDFLKSVTTCQCTLCRKQTGSLIFRVQDLPKSAVTYNPPHPTSLKAYHASEGCSRLFCSNCGSFIAWRIDDSNSMSVCVGTIDKEYLLKYGTLLTYGERHLYTAEEIPGVTDHLKGERHDYSHKW